MEPLFETSQTYEARAYLFRGLKSDEQKYRRRNFKRCQRNRFCEQSLEQGGRKWVISRCIMNIPVEPSCYGKKPSVSPSQIPTTAVPEQFDRVREPTGSYTSSNIRNIAHEYMDASRAMRPPRVQVRADSSQINFVGLEALDENDTPVVAKDSAVASSSPGSGNSHVTLITHSPYHKEKADCDSTSGPRKRKPPEQLERRRERRRRAQQIRRLMMTDKQNKEPTPRVFMQWEKSEVQRLLHKQELALKSAHQAELQKQELTIKSALQAELLEQKFTLKSAHQAELRKQELVLKAALLVLRAPTYAPTYGEPYCE